MKRRVVENGSKINQNGPKMPPKLLPGDLWAALGRRLCFQRLPGALLEGLWGGPGVPKKSLLAAWGPPGAESWSISCLRGVPGRPPEGPGEAPGGHFGDIFAAGPCGTKKVRNFKEFSTFLEGVFGSCVFRFLRLPGGAGARAHLEKRGFHVESVAFFACPAFARGTKKRRNFEETQSKIIRTMQRTTNAETQAKNINI